MLSTMMLVDLGHVIRAQISLGVVGPACRMCRDQVPERCWEKEALEALTLIGLCSSRVVGLRVCIFSSACLDSDRRVEYVV